MNLSSHFQLPYSQQLVKDALGAIYRAKAGGVNEPYLQDQAWKTADLSLMGVPQKVDYHTDSYELPGYTYFLVITNTGFVVRQKGEKMPDLQVPGTIFGINIHENHGLFQDPRAESSTTIIFPDEPVDGASFLVFGSETQLSTQEVEDEFHQRFAVLTQLLPEYAEELQLS